MCRLRVARGEKLLRKRSILGWLWVQGVGELAAAARKLYSPKLGTLSAVSASFTKLSASSSFCKGSWEWWLGLTEPSEDGLWLPRDRARRFRNVGQGRERRGSRLRGLVNLVL